MCPRGHQRSLVFVDLHRYTVKELALSLPKQAWKRKSAGWGTKGRRWPDWALWEVGGVNPGWHSWLLVWRSVEPPDELAY